MHGGRLRECMDAEGQSVCQLRKTIYCMNALSIHHSSAAPLFPLCLPASALVLGPKNISASGSLASGVSVP